MDPIDWLLLCAWVGLIAFVWSGTADRVRESVLLDSDMEWARKQLKGRNRGARG